MLRRRSVFTQTQQDELHARYDPKLDTDKRLKEYGAGVGECAIDCSDAKVVKDEGKLTREAKDAADKILKVVSENVNAKVQTVQIAGSSCSIPMLDIFDVGLYVANYKYAFDIPNTTTNFIEKIDIILKYLLTMQRDVVKLRNLIVSSQEPESNHGNSFNREHKIYELNPRLQYTRNTYYTPPKGSVSKLPHHYYGPPLFYSELATRFFRKGLCNASALKMAASHMISMGLDPLEMVHTITSIQRDLRTYIRCYKL